MIMIASTKQYMRCFKLHSPTQNVKFNGMVAADYVKCSCLSREKCKKGLFYLDSIRTLFFLNTDFFVRDSTTICMVFIHFTFHWKEMEMLMESFF